MKPRQSPLDASRQAGTEALLARWRAQRDGCARQELVRRFLPLARKLALRYARASEPTEDLVQVACLGLLGAIDRFDPERGSSFPSFAVPTILGELKRYFRDHSWSLHMPRREQELALRVRDSERDLIARLGRQPTIDQLAVELQLSCNEVRDGLEVSRANRGFSLDAPIGEDDGDGDPSLGDTVGRVDDGYGLVDATASLATAIKLLTQADRDLLSLRFAENLTQTEIAKRIGVSQMQVSRLLRAALGRLRERTGPAFA